MISEGFLKAQYFSCITAPKRRAHAMKKAFCTHSPVVLLSPLVLLALAASLTTPAKTQTALPVVSQWANSGANIFNANAGNVGIGTSAPSAKLHLSGGMKIELLNTLEFGAGRF